ncbi:hypothetical protein [Peribacillus sp. NPDC097895]|uniref:hypothetical protein n=1 Tax=Peribacillus sp. NPDC097895 TaxID=3390619 RepID=UPI003D068096
MNDFKENVINGIMIDGLGKDFVSTSFAIRKGVLDTKKLITIYTSGSSFPKDLLKYAADFEMIKKDRS